jgi:hypothetical protein
MAFLVNNGRRIPVGHRAMSGSNGGLLLGGLRLLSRRTSSVRFSAGAVAVMMLT